MKTKRPFALFISFFLVSIISSCETDISRNPVKHTDFIVGQVYQLKKPAFIDENGTLWVLGQLGTSESLEEFKTKMHSYWKGPIDLGTTLVVRKITYYHYNPENGPFTSVYAELLSGEGKGKVFDISWISERDYKTAYVKRNPSTLEPVEEPSR